MVLRLGGKPKSNTPWQNIHAMLNISSSRAEHACTAVLSNFFQFDFENKEEERLKKIKNSTEGDQHLHAGHY